LDAPEWAAREAARQRDGRGSKRACAGLDGLTQASHVAWLRPARPYKPQGATKQATERMSSWRTTQA